MIERGEIKDPRVSFVSVTDVNVSQDLRYCKVFYSLMGSEQDREDAAQGLKSASGVIRTELGRRLQLKFAPEITFEFDRSVEASARIAKILHDIREKETDDES